MCVRSKQVAKQVSVYPRIDALCFLAVCRTRQLNQGLVVALDFSLRVREGTFMRYFLVSGFVQFVTFSLSLPVQLIAWEDWFVSEMTCCVSSETLNLTN